MYCGVDGCPAGWITVTWDGAGYAGATLCSSFSDVLELSAETIAVDMPIGLPDTAGKNGRTCESLASARLGMLL